MDLKGKSILITGGSRGIGRATAILAGKQGANVAINYFKDKKSATATTREVEKAGGKAAIVQGDVAKSTDATRMIKKTKEKFGSLDILINNAGLSAGFKPLEEVSLAKWHQVVDVNVKGVINTTYAVIPIMQKQKGGGVIVNIASGAGKSGIPNLSVYSATKFAVLGFTDAMGKELADRNVRVYAVCPGMTATDMTGHQGMPVEKVGQKIIKAASESLNLRPGENTEIYRKIKT